MGEKLIWANVFERFYTITPPEESDERFSDRGRTGLNAELKAISLSRLEGYDAIAVSDWYIPYGVDNFEAGDTVYAVFVIYETGDTFGSTEAWCIAGIKKDLGDAQITLDECAKDEPDSLRRPWDGYFEDYVSGNVVPLVVT